MTHPLRVLILSADLVATKIRRGSNPLPFHVEISFINNRQTFCSRRKCTLMSAHFLFIVFILLLSGCGSMIEKEFIELQYDPPASMAAFDGDCKKAIYITEIIDERPKKILSRLEISSVTFTRRVIEYYTSDEVSTFAKISLQNRLKEIGCKISEDDADIFVSATLFYLLSSVNFEGVGTYFDAKAQAEFVVVDKASGRALLTEIVKGSNSFEKEKWCGWAFEICVSQSTQNAIIDLVDNFIKEFISKGILQ